MNKCNESIAFSGIKDEYYCIINSGDNLQDLAEEISMRVSAATQFIMESKPYSKINKAFSKKYKVTEMIA